MKKEGISTIEVIAVLSIMIVLMSIGIGSSKHFKDYISSLEYKSDIYNIREIMTYSRQYCYENKVYGELYFINSDESIRVYLLSKKRIVKSIDISRGKRIENFNYVLDGKQILKIDINEDGYISPYTINISDNTGTKKKIVIQVGGNLVYIKDD